MYLPGTVPTEEEVNDGLDAAAEGTISEGYFDPRFDPIFMKVAHEGKVSDVDREQALDLRDQIETETNIAEANGELERPLTPEEWNAKVDADPKLQKEILARAKKSGYDPEA